MEGKTTNPTPKDLTVTDEEVHEYQAHIHQTAFKRLQYCVDSLDSLHAVLNCIVSYKTSNEFNDLIDRLDILREIEEKRYEMAIKRNAQLHITQTIIFNNTETARKYEVALQELIDKTNTIDSYVTVNAEPTFLYTRILHKGS